MRFCMLPNENFQGVIKIAGFTVIPITIFLKEIHLILFYILSHYLMANRFQKYLILSDFKSMKTYKRWTDSPMMYRTSIFKSF